MDWYRWDKPETNKRQLEETTMDRRVRHKRQPIPLLYALAEQEEEEEEIYGEEPTTILATLQQLDEDAQQWRSFMLANEVVDEQSPLPQEEFVAATTTQEEEELQEVVGESEEEEEETKTTSTKEKEQKHEVILIDDADEAVDKRKKEEERRQQTMNWRKQLEEEFRNTRDQNISMLMKSLTLKSEQSKAATDEFRQTILGIDNINRQREKRDQLAVPLLSKEQLKLVQMAFSRGRGDDIIVEGFNLELHRSDIKLLMPSEWLNDEIINFYMALLEDRSNKLSGDQSNRIPKCRVMNTFFYALLLNSGRGYTYSRVRKWTKAIDVFEYDYILVPVHLGNHWCLAAVSIKEKKIIYYDSLGGNNGNCTESLKKWLIDEWKDKHPGVPPTSDFGNWEVSVPKDIPAQRNGYDCGVFTCKYAECLTRGAPFKFSQNDMPQARKVIALELITKSLLLH